MFENPRRGRQARNFTTNASKILDLKSSSEQIFLRKLSLGAPGVCQNSTRSRACMSESVEKRCRPSHGGAYMCPYPEFSCIGEEEACYFQAPATQARRKPCLCRYFASVVALVFVAYADLSTPTILPWVFLTFLKASWQHSQSHGFPGKISMKWGASVETTDAVLNLKGRRHIGMQD